ncbi:MAG: DUF2500 family protein [Planctomycetes bacterium]|nr:DUF2500 family protein [Planctomycetota bacterium]MCB9902801.1 DUF2500 family protein [Planctomycetota bacterium]
MSATECQHCGAVIKSQGARFCEFCGTEIVREGAPRMQTRDEAQRTRFELLREHPELDGLLRATPTIEKPPLNYGILVVAPVMVLFVLFFLGGVRNAGAPGFFFLVPVLMLGVVGYAALKVLMKSSEYHSAELVRRPAIVVDERTKFSGGGKDTSARTTYFATLEFDDGSRSEFTVGSRLAGNITQGDAGVAYTKHRHLAAFARLSV